MNPRRVQHLLIVLVLGCVVCLTIAFRVQRRSTWMVDAPLRVGNWEAVDVPLSQEMLQQLALPRAVGREYRNPLDERVTVHVIAPTSFESFREPPEFNGFEITARRAIPLFGPDKPVRAWVLRFANGARVLMYCWIQGEDGTIRQLEQQSLQQSNLERFTHGWDALTTQRKECIIRVFAVVTPLDDRYGKGIQARRNMDEVARALYAAAQKGKP